MKCAVRNMDNTSNPVILIADSSESFFDSLQATLETTDYACVHARNGEEAIRFHDLLKSEIDVAIIELELPTSGGCEVIKRFNQCGRKPRKIIATSSIFPDSFLQQVRFQGVDAVVRKPIGLQAWLQLIKQPHLCSTPSDLGGIAGGCPDLADPSPVPGEPALPMPPPGERRGSLPRLPLSYFVAVLVATCMVLTLFVFGGLLETRQIAAAAKPDPTSMLCPVIVPLDAPPAAMKPVEVATTPPHRAILRPIQRRQKQPISQPAASVVLFRGFTPLRQTDLNYPVEARKQRISGEVEMQITIRQDGSVQNPRVLSGDPQLSSGLVAEVSKWLYKPLRINGEPVEMVTELAIRYNLSSTAGRSLPVDPKFSKEERLAVSGIEKPLTY